MPDAKRCSNCGEVRGADSFFKRTAAKDGLQPHCKPCQKAMQAERSKTEKWKASIKEWKESNPERNRAHKRAWVKSNLAYFRAKARGQAKQLAPNYVKGLMRRSLPGLTEIPDALLEAETQRLQLKRLIKEMVDGQH